MRNIDHHVKDFYFLRVSNMWRFFKSQHFSFWMICGYLFFEFVKPQSLFPVLAVVPWAQLLLIAALMGCFMDPSVKIFGSKTNFLMILFCLLITFSIFTAIYPDFSKRYLVNYYSWFVVYFLTIYIVNTPERFYIFLMIFILAAGKIAFGTSKSWAFRGFSFTDWGLMGPRGYFQNSGELAILMLMLFPLAYYTLDYLKENISTLEKLLLRIFWICPVLTILGASSRGAQIALVAQLLIIFRRSLLKPKSLSLVVVLTFSGYMLLPDEQKQRFSNVGEDKTSLQRMLYWENGWEMMKEYPLTGVGYFNFIPYYQDYYPEDMLYDKAELPHNIFIQVGTDAGFIALAVFMLLIVSALINARAITRIKTHHKLYNYVGAGLGVGILGFVIAGQFVTVTYYPFFWVHLSLIMALKYVLTTDNLKRSTL